MSSEIRVQELNINVALLDHGLSDAVNDSQMLIAVPFPLEDFAAQFTICWPSLKAAMELLKVGPSVAALGKLFVAHQTLDLFAISLQPLVIEAAQG